MRIQFYRRGGSGWSRTSLSGFSGQHFASKVSEPKMVVPLGLEPRTARISAECANQLRQRTACWDSWQGDRDSNPGRIDLESSIVAARTPPYTPRPGSACVLDPGLGMESARRNRLQAVTPRICKALNRGPCARTRTLIVSAPNGETDLWPTHGYRAHRLALMRLWARVKQGQHDRLRKWPLSEANGLYNGSARPESLWAGRGSGEWIRTTVSGV